VVGFKRIPLGEAVASVFAFAAFFAVEAFAIAVYAFAYIAVAFAVALSVSQFGFVQVVVIELFNQDPYIYIRRGSSQGLILLFESYNGYGLLNSFF